MNPCFLGIPTYSIGGLRLAGVSGLGGGGLKLSRGRPAPYLGTMRSSIIETGKKIMLGIQAASQGGTASPAMA